MPPKTSFKALLGKAGSNPTVSLTKVRAQREQLQQLRQPAGAPPAKVARTTAEAARPAPPQPAALPQPAASSSSASAAFMPAGMFAGARPGYVFKAGDSGLGYYRDGAAPLPIEPRVDADEAGASGEGASGAAASALPQNFFDNPQQDPANKGKAVASTHKEQTLNEELAEFNKLVEADLVAADEADEVADEDEEEGKLREAVSVARELEAKIEGLKRQRAAMAVAASANGGATGTTATAASASGSADGGGDGGGAADADDDDDDDDDDAGLDSLFDWRAKGV